MLIFHFSQNPPQRCYYNNMNIEVAKILFLIFFFLTGAVLGSFACCQAWRIHLKESGKKKINGKTVGNRSVCLSCGHQLSATENIPILSWIFLRGKCKKCGKKIGLAEILSELSLGAVFLILGFFIWPDIISIYSFNWSIVLYFVNLTLLVVGFVLMWILMIYDAKWGKLPTFLLVTVNIVAALFFSTKLLSIIISGTFSTDAWPLVLNLIGSVAILAGIYYLLYKLSREKLVGGGDWILALAIAIMLGSWWLALIALFLSNFLASIYGIAQKIKTKSSLIYFGPFLVIAFVIVFFCQSWLLRLSF